MEVFNLAGTFKSLRYPLNFVLVGAVLLVGCGSSTQKETTTTKVKSIEEDIVNEKTFRVDIKDPLFKYQWHLVSENGYDLNISDAWKVSQGKGIKVAVVDTGIEANHEDLKENVDLNLSFCYEDGSHNPTPTASELKNPFIDVTHGTAVAGIIGGVQNGIGIVGVAPKVSLVGLNVFSNAEDSSFEDAMLYKGVDVSSNSWGNDLSNGLDDDRVVLDAIVQKMQTDPTIFVFATGNESANANFSSVLNSRYTLPIGAITFDGKVANYSNYGANLLAVAPGGGSYAPKKRIVTTDLNGSEYGYDSYRHTHFDKEENKAYNYTNTMNGTSAAAPMVSAVIALMLESNKKLTYRDVKDIIIHSSRKIDKTGSSWKKNGADIWVSDKYGFGLVDASNAVKMAKKYIPMAKEISIEKEAEDTNITIPDDDDNGVEVEFDIKENFVVEYVRLEIATNHTYSGDLEISLTSPDGTTSIVAYGGTITNDSYMPWSFASIEFYEELSQGVWKVNIVDKEKKNSGTLLSSKLNIYGHLAK